MRASLLSALALAAPATAQTWEQALRPAVTIAGQTVRATLVERMAHWRVPGVSVAVIDGCRIVEARAFGIATPAGAPVTPATLFQAASISKPIAAAVTLRLAEAGRVSLDADVRPVLRRWTLPGTAPVTLRALLGHSAGVGVGGFPGYPVGAALPTLSQLLDGAPPANTPAVRVDGPAGVWRYSGGGYEIVQAALEDAAGEPFAGLAERLVLAPAGMADSAFDQPIAPERAARAAAGFSDAGVPLAGGAHVYPELAAAGLWTTPTDLARFAVALARSLDGDGLLSPESARAMTARGAGHWGLGVDLGPAGAAPRFGHTGSNAGFTSAFVLYPHGCRGVAVMTNGDEARGLVAETMRAIGDAYGWLDRADPPVVATVPMTRAITRRFAGRWQLRGTAPERFTIAASAGGLSWTRDGHGARELVAASGRRLVSPDGPLTITAGDARPVAQRVTVTFGDVKSVAMRVRQSVRPELVSGWTSSSQPTPPQVAAAASRPSPALPRAWPRRTPRPRASAPGER